MSQSPKPRGLGRGLSALLGDEEIVATVAPSPLEAPSSQTPSRPPLTLPIGRLKPGKMQPRTTFEDLDALVDSVKEFGLLQPILVRPVPGQSDAYEIVAGERRWRAAQRAQLHEVPVVVRSMDDRDALQVGLIENLQRADLTAIDEAQAYRRLVEDFKQSHDEIAKTVGKSRPHVANTVRLLELPGAVLEMIRRGQLSAGQARALVGLPDPLVMAERALQEQLTVRALERMAGDLKSKSRPRASKPEVSKSADTRALEKRIEEALGLKAELKLRGLGEQSLLTLEIRDFDQLDAVVDRLTRR
ncbi:MAG: ParB family transcriptional regulator, chromosome partitioning protein [Rhodospirillaceae bacterium]|jgi:ParB family chromosome partitioning protein|nr:ParB family transcriptional regulator, chromosome partitioning protein [Rhodospirillaceae bacterium]